MEEPIITKLQSLKKVSPDANWVAFNKQQLFGAPVQNTNSLGWLNFLFRPVAYTAMTVFALAAVGTFLLPQPAALPVSPAVSGSSVASNLQELQERTANLQKVAVQNPQEAPKAASAVKAVEKKLADLVKQDPSSAKQVAVELQNNQTLLSADNSNDLKPSTDNLYKATDDSLIASLKQETLTNSQQQALNDAEQLYSQGDYAGALVKILLVSNNN